MGTISSVDGLVLSILAMMTVSMGIVLLIVLTICRSAARRDASVDELLEEIEAERRKISFGKTSSVEARKPWEQDADWWKTSKS